MVRLSFPCDGKEIHARRPFREQRPMEDLEMSMAWGGGPAGGDGGIQRGPGENSDWAAAGRWLDAGCAAKLL